jgi:putative transposase
MDTSTAPSYRGYRFPREIIGHCVWLYFRFCLSFRDIQEMMLERGVEVSYEAIRLWCLKFAADYSKRLRCRRGQAGGTWHLDEVFCKIHGELVYLWRAVDHSGEVLVVLIQKAIADPIPSATRISISSTRGSNSQKRQRPHEARA